jgi:hypothetical protein
MTRTADTGYVQMSEVQGDHIVNYKLELDKLFNNHLEQGTDLWAIHAGYISVSLLRFEVNHHDIVQSTTECVEKIASDFFGNVPG